MLPAFDLTVMCSWSKSNLLQITPEGKEMRWNENDLVESEKDDMGYGGVKDGKSPQKRNHHQGAKLEMTISVRGIPRRT